MSSRSSIIPSVFAQIDDYIKHFVPLVEMDRKYDEEVKLSSVLAPLNLDWAKIESSQRVNNVAKFDDVDDKLRTAFDLSAGSFVTFYRPKDINNPVDAIQSEYFLGFCGKPRYKEPFYVVIDENAKGMRELLSKKNTFPKKGWAIRHVFDPLVYDLMLKSIKQSLYNFNAHFLKVFLGNEKYHPVAPDVEDNTDWRLRSHSQHHVCDEQRIFRPENLPEKILHAPSLKKLNDSQRRAIEMALVSPILACIGPPGTGKSTTLSNLIYHMHEALKKEHISVLQEHYEKKTHMENLWDLREFTLKAKQNSKEKEIITLAPKPTPILVGAPSNVAADHLAALLLKIPGLDILRISSNSYQKSKCSASDDSVENSALHRRIQTWMTENPQSELSALHGKFFGQMDDPEQQEKLASDLNDILGGSSSDDSKKHHVLTLIESRIGEARKSAGFAKADDADKLIWVKLLRKLIHSIIISSDVVVTTFNKSATLSNYGDIKFEHVVLDEVGQSTEPQLLLPLSSNPKHLILFGDHHQLPPTVMCREAVKLGLDRSLFSRLVTTQACPVVWLETQYRMHPAIAAFSNGYIYEDRISNGVTELQKNRFNTFFPWPEPNKPICFIDTKGLSKTEQHGTSQVNEFDARVIEKLLMQFVKQGTQLDDIGLVVAYTGQVNFLKQMLKNPQGDFFRLVKSLYCNPDSQSAHNDASELIDTRLAIGSIDKFQGQEKPLIILNTVNTNSYTSFFTQNRINVGITRAQEGLIIVGSSALARTGDVMDKLVDHFRTNGALVPPSELKSLLKRADKLCDENEAKNTATCRQQIRETRNREMEMAQQSLKDRPSLLNKDAMPFYLSGPPPSQA